MVYLIYFFFIVLKLILPYLQSNNLCINGNLLLFIFKKGAAYTLINTVVIIYAIHFIM
jgi:hypothetical protein